MQIPEDEIKSMTERFHHCKYCVTIIDVFMDRYFADKRDAKILYCVGCALRPELQEFTYEVAGNAGIASKVIFKMGPGPENEFAPPKQTFVCIHCGKQHNSRSMLKLLCGDDVNFNPLLVWTYSIKTDARGLVVNYINARIGH